MKRMFSFLMALVLVLSILPMPVRAEGACICDSKCASGEGRNTDCPVCSANWEACAYEGPIVNTDISVTSIGIDGAGHVKVGGTLQLNAVVEPADATDKTVTWSSSDNAKATVNEHGLVTAVSAGEVTITAKAGVVSKACTVNVVVPVESVSLNKDTASIAVDATETLTATVAPAGAYNQNVSWKSSDKTIATVESGVVTAVAPGTATITATTVDGGFTATCAVTVPGVVLNKNSVELKAGSNETLTATVFPAGTDVTWSSSAETVAAVESGIVTAVKPGTATITATVGAYSTTCTVTVPKLVPTYTAPVAKDLYYTGEAQELVTAGRVTDGQGKIEYKLDSGEYSETVPTASAVGTYTVSWKITGNETYVDVPESTIDVKIGYDISKAEVTLNAASFTYDAKAHAPAATVMYGENKLTEGTDYTLSFQQKAKAGEGPVNAGTYQVVVTGIGGYKGQVAVDFAIVPVELTSDNTTVNVAEGPYFVGAEPAVKVELNVDSNSEELAEENYSVTYENNDKPGDATVKVIGTGNYTGSITEKYTIEAGPANRTVNVGTTAEFTVINGEGWTHQWQIKKDGDWVNMPGATESSYTTAAATIEMNGTQYRCVITNSKGAEATSPAATLTVKVPVTDVALNKTSLTLAVDKTEKLVATVKPDNANQNVNWTSSDSNVAAVDANGNVTAKNAGTATITATTVDGAKTATCKVTVVFTVTFNSNGGEAFTPGTKTVKPGEKLSKPEKDPTRKVTDKDKAAQWRFDGWYATEACTKGTEWDFEKNTVTKDITLYAKWVGQYELKFGTNTSAAVKKMPETMLEDSREFRVTSTKPTRSGYAFSSWNTEKDGSGTKVKAGAKFTMPDDQVSVTLYAQWKKADLFNAKTGDYILIAIGVLAVSGLALAGLWVYSKKKK